MKTANVTIDWHSWCRLCAKEDSQSTHVFSENLDKLVKNGKCHDDLCKGDLNIPMALQRHFNIQIKREDKLPQQLCTECFSIVKSLLDFAERVERVQHMYKALQISPNNTVASAKTLRLSFGVPPENTLQIFPQQPLPEIHFLAIKPKPTELEETVSEEDVASASNNPLDIEQSSMSIGFQKKCFLEYADEVDNDNVKEEDLSESYGNHHIKSATSTPIKEPSTLENVSQVDKNCQDQLKEEQSSDSFKNESETEDDTNLATLRTIIKRERNLPHKKWADSKKEQRREGQHEDNTDMKTCASNLETNTIQEKFKYNCSECPQQFKFMQNYRNHMKKIHNSTPIVPKNPCTQCSQVFKTRAQLKQHSRKHLPLEEKRVVPCPYCDKKFTSKSAVDLHVKYAHLDERSFICEECGFAVRTLWTLREHMLVHTDKTPFECAVCHNKFKNRSRLTKHMQIHDEKKHICAVCGLQLNSRKTLNCHMVVHSDKMQHKCESCGRAFKRAKTLKNHLLIHTGLRLYSCDFCDRTFTVGSSCRQHKKKEHPKELAELEASGEKAYTRNIPRIEELKAVTKATGNLITLASKRSENISLEKASMPSPKNLSVLPKAPTKQESIDDANLTQ